jgi:hypothetical protein
MPNALSAFALLAKFSPEDIRIHAYICQTYVAYGRSSMAFDYVSKNSAFFGSKTLSLYEGLFPVLFDYADVPEIGTAVAALTQILSSDGLSPDDRLQIMAYRAKVPFFLLGKKRFAEAIQSASADLKLYDSELAAEENSESYRDKSEDDKAFYFKLLFPVGRLEHLEVISRANIGLGMRDDKALYGTHEAILADIARVKCVEGSQFAKERPKYRGRVLESMIRVANRNGDKAKAEEFLRRSKEP